jgi:hypothetical protein
LRHSPAGLDDDVLLTRQGFDSLHRTWLVLVLLATLAAASWYGWTWRESGRLPGGGSLPGLVLGTLAGLICLFETALVVRKTSLLRTRRTILGIPLGTARQWMAAHLWLGLLSVPLVAMHAGFAFGGTLSWLLAWSFILVIASGVVGLVLQNVLPRLLTDTVPEETIYSQIEEIGRQFAVDAVRLAELYGGPAPPGRWEHLQRHTEKETAAAAGEVVAGAPRTVGTLVARARHPQVEIAATNRSPELHRALEECVVDFLLTGQSTRLTTTQRIDWYFEDLERRVRPEARPAVEQIRSLCQRRRQLNVQKAFHFWLHSWLSIHLPLSVALLWLLAAHVIGALVYS